MGLKENDMVIWLPCCHPLYWNCANTYFLLQHIVCIKCDDYDLCGNCYTRRDEVHDTGHTFEKLTDPRLRWYGIVCDGCKRHSFPGARYVCLSCPDYGACMQLYAVGQWEIVFISFHRPMYPLPWKSSFYSSSRSWFRKVWWPCCATLLSLLVSVCQLYMSHK